MYKGWQMTSAEDSYFRDELQHSLDTFHYPLSFTTNQHHPVCRLRTTLLKQLDAGLCVLETQTKAHISKHRKRESYYMMQ